MGGLAPVQLFVAQEGNSKNTDTVLVPTSPEAAAFNKYDLVNMTGDFFRVRQWSSPTLFMRLSLDIFVTGTCEPVGSSRPSSNLLRVP